MGEIEEGIKEGIKEKLDEISCLARETRGDWTDPRANMREICSLVNEIKEKLEQIIK